MPERDLAEWIHEEHKQVAQLADQLRESVAIVPRACTQRWIQTTQARFEEYRTLLLRHMAFEEREDYMSAVLERRPTLSGRVERLEREHRDMARLLEDLNGLTQELTPDRMLLVRDFCTRIQSLLNYVEHHENEENDLVEFVFTQDVGGTD